MSDDELRALERAAQAEGGPARLRYAWALDRAGRADDAWRVMLGALDDPEVRREVARAPCWGQLGGGSGVTSYVDLPPLLREPRTRVTRRLGPLADAFVPDQAEGADEEDPVYTSGFVASPLGLVWAAHSGFCVLDPKGDLRYRSPYATGANVMIAAELLVVAEKRRLTARDLWTGSAVDGEVVLEEHVVGLDADLLVLADRTRVTGLAWPASLVRRGVRFETDLPATFLAAGPRRARRVLLAATRVYVSTTTEHVALDRSSGRVLFGGPGAVVQADATGFVVEHHPVGHWGGPRHLALHDVTGGPCGSRRPLAAFRSRSRPRSSSSGTTRVDET